MNPLAAVAASDKPSEIDLRNNEEKSVAKQDNAVSDLCTIIGFAANIAWLPALLLDGALSNGWIASATQNALPYPFSGLSSASTQVFCLAICSILGLALILCADRVRSVKTLFRFWAAGAACTVLTLSLIHI